MSLTKNQQITIFCAVLGAAVLVWVTLYTYSPDIINNEIRPPDSISFNTISNFEVEISNHGTKTGSYELLLKSENNSLNFSKWNTGDYTNNLKLSYLLPPSDIDSWLISVKMNESCVQDNFILYITLIDASGIIDDSKSYVYLYSYDSESNKYYLQE